MRDAALQISQHDLQSHGSDEFSKKVYNNPLKRTFRILSTILIKRSHEEMIREAMRKRQVREAKAAKEIQSAAIEATVSSEGIYPVSGPRQPSTLPATPQNRNVSDSSFGKRSTETTPTKLIKPESSIQNLQNTFVQDVLDALYDSDFIRMPWARGRKNLRLIYEPYAFRIERL